MRNPVNRLATAAPRAFDSILKQPTSTTSTTSDSTTTQERGRSASFHVDLSVLLNTTSAEQGVGGSASSVSGVDTMGDETGSVLTFDAAMDVIPWGWNEEGEVGL